MSTVIIQRGGIPGPGSDVLTPLTIRAETAATGAEANAQVASDAAEQAAASAASAEAVGGPTYASTAEGIAATTSGQTFAVDEGGGIISVYLNSEASAVFQRRLATSDALALNQSGGGLDLIGRPSVNAMLSSTAPARGEGAVWHADDFTYSEAASSATDHDLVTAGGVKLYVQATVRGKDVKAFGAVGNGTVDDTIAIQRTALVGKTVIIPTGNYLLSGISITEDQTIRGDNALLKTVTDTDTLITANAVHDWRVEGLRLEGSLTTSVDPDDESEIGLFAGDAARNIISNTTFSRFKKYGLYRYSLAFSNEGSTGRGCQTLGVALGFYNNTVGLKTGEGSGSEYDVYSVFHAGGNGIGADLCAGNTILTGFHLVDNFLNLRLRGGNNNHLHNIIGDGTINHIATGGTYLMYATDIWNGVSISNVAAYANGAGGDGPLYWERTGGINWFNGILDAWTYINSTGFDAEAYYPYNRQENLFMPGGYGPARVVNQADSSAYHPFLIRKNCFGPGSIDEAGVTSNDPYDLFVWAQQNGATIPFTSGDFIKFPTVNRLGDRRKCYNPATGLITIPKWMTGLYEYEANFVVSGTLADVADSYFELVLDPVGTDAPYVVSPFLKPIPNADGLIRWQVNTGRVVVHLTAGDVIGLRATYVGGTNPGLGESPWVSFFTLRKIA